MDDIKPAPKPVPETPVKLPTSDEDKPRPVTPYEPPEEA